MTATTNTTQMVIQISLRVASGAWTSIRLTYGPIRPVRSSHRIASSANRNDSSSSSSSSQISPRCKDRGGHRRVGLVAAKAHHIGKSAPGSIDPDAGAGPAICKVIQLNTQIFWQKKLIHIVYIYVYVLKKERKKSK
jgi:hypothetical protein